MSGNDMHIIREVHADDFNVYHVDLDEHAATGRIGRAVAVHLTLRDAIDWANRQAAEYSYVVRLLPKAKA